jgi:outer membrane biosynthesis protein TonB
MRGKATLLAVVLVVVGCGAGAVWLAANDDDHPSTAGFQGPLAEKPPATAPQATTTEEQPQPEQQQPEAKPEPEQTEQPQQPEQATPPKRETRFKREQGTPSDDPPQRRFVVPPAREFSGEGNAQLGTVNVKTTAVLKWSSKGRLEIRFGREAFPIVAPTKSGQLVLPPFRFERVRVLAAGRWKITVSPQ